MASKTAHDNLSATPEAIEEMLDLLDKTLDRLKVLYEQYFLGIQKQAPAYLHTDVERKLRDLTQIQIRNTGLRYRYATLQQKFGSYNSYWRRTLRQIENGTYARNLSKIGRAAARSGEEIPEEILAAMPKRMREQVVRDREQALTADARRKAAKTEAVAEPETLELEGDEPPLGEEDAVAIISEPTELRRNLRSRSGAHVVEESDATMDLDAFFASVEQQKEVARPSSATRQTGPVRVPVPPETDPGAKPLTDPGVVQAPATDPSVKFVARPATDPGVKPVVPGGVKFVSPTRAATDPGVKPVVPGPARAATDPGAKPVVPGPARAATDLGAKFVPRPATDPGVKPVVPGPARAATDPGAKFVPRPATDPGVRPVVPGPARAATDPGVKPVPPVSPPTRAATDPNAKPQAVPAPADPNVKRAVMPTPAAGIGVVPKAPAAIGPKPLVPPPPVAARSATPSIPPVLPKVPPPVAKAPSQTTRPNPIAPGAASAHGPVAVDAMAGPFPRTPHAEPAPVRPAPAARPAPRPQPDAPPMKPPPGMTDADVNALYAKYVTAKEMVGEVVGPGGQAKLLKTINAQAPKIMEQYKAKAVDFSVVVKDNQVIIRAKPKL